tara:strand:- start:492 stop:665 length:174 start_codon:yes stop_codon:yes gene_type:complete
MEYLENLSRQELAFYYANLLYNKTGKNITSKDVIILTLKNTEDYFIKQIIKLSTVKL